MVKRIDEVRPELQLEPLRKREVLMQTQVHVGVPRPTQLSELWRAISKGPSDRVSEVVSVGEPLEATDSSGDWRFSGDARDGVAIRTRTSTERPGLISGVVNRHRPTTTDDEDWTDRPASNNGIHDLVGVPC